ncbi:MAG: hypothetical protein ACI9C1_000216 [Candidatus Aldehydirespiratoraceae bacterium]|jgi:hypothetical protein
MRRHRQPLLGAIAICLLAALVAAPATAQVNPGELASLERQRDELTIAVGEVDAELEQLSLEIAALAAQIVDDGVVVELIADSIEWTVFTRQEPANTRVEIAIVGFTQGDPRSNALLDEVRTLEGDDEPSRRRALYESVIDDTEGRLEIIDAQLQELAGELDVARDELSTRNEALLTVEEDHREAGARRSELADQLSDMLQRIEALRALEARAVLTGQSTFDDPTRPALAVKIDNVPAARPQAGINQADIVFVEEVEGGLTRLAAVFHSEGAEAVGPVRSMRTGDFDLLAQLNGPLFANSGGNRGSRAQLKNSSLVDVSVNVFSSSYYRDSGRRAPHNLITNAFNLWSLGRNLEGAATPSPFFQFRTASQPLPSGAQSINGVSIDYGSTRVEYSWNGSGWDRTQDGQPTVDADGVRVAPTTVVVQFTDYIPSSADARSPEAVTIADGTAWVLTAGQLVPVAWNREALAEQTKYRIPGSGNEVAILPGKIWIELPRPGEASSN